MEPIPLGTADRTILVFLPDPASTDGSGKTGLTHADLTVSYARVETDNDVVVTDATSSLSTLSALTDAHADWGVKEVSSTLAPGLYRLDVADAVFASGAWYAVVYVMATSSAAAATPKAFQLVAYNPLDGVRLGLTALPNAAADAAGGLPVSDAGGLDLDAKIGALTFGTANRVNAQVYGMEADTVTAAAVAPGAIDAATFAADVDAEILSYLVDDATRIDASALNTASVTSIPAVLADTNELQTDWANGGRLDLIVDDILADTAVIGAAGAGLTAVPWNAAWDAEVQSEVQDAIEANNLDHLVKAAVDTNFATTVHLDSVIGHLADAGTTATFDRTTDALEVLGAATAPSAASIADAVWDETLADHLAGGSTGAGLNSASSAGDPWGTALPGAYSAGTAGHIIGNRIDAAVTSRQATIWSSDSATVNLSGTTVKAVTDRVTANADQFGGSSTPVSRLDSLLDTYVNNGYLDGNLVAVVSDAFSPTYLAAMAAAHDGGTLDVRNVTGAAASVSALAANSVTAAALAADAGTEIGTAVWAAGTRTLTAGTNIALAKGTGVTGFTDLSAADVRTAVGLASANLDTQMGDLPTNAELATALGTADDATLAAIAALNNLSAAQVAAAVPTATAIADAILGRNVSNVETTMPEHSLGTLVLAALESAVAGTTWTIKGTDGSTTRFTKTVTVDADADPITGVS